MSEVRLRNSKLPPEVGLHSGSVSFSRLNKDANSLANLLLQDVYQQFGLPNSIISDRGPQFTLQVFKELGRLLGIKTKMSTVYHPQTNRSSERTNQELETYLWIFCANNSKDWKKKLITAEFSHNQCVHDTQKHLPFFLMMGYHP